MGSSGVASFDQYFRLKLYSNNFSNLPRLENTTKPFITMQCDPKNAILPANRAMAYAISQD